MKIVLLAEGETERRSLPCFLKRWLDPKMSRRVSLKCAMLHGSGEFQARYVRAACRYLAEGFAVVGLLDWYESGLRPPQEIDLSQQYSWARKTMESKVGSGRFRQHFAVHETEAWLLSAPGIFPAAVQQSFPRNLPPPEAVDLQVPPSKLLKRLYQQALSQPYRKVEEGFDLFVRLDPELAASRCPHLRMLLEDLLDLARMEAP